MLLLTGHPPFIRHDNNDQLYKLVNEKMIGKFWQCIGKRAEQKIPDQLIELIKRMFLGKGLTLEQILDSEWLSKGRLLEPFEVKAYFKGKDAEN